MKMTKRALSVVLAAMMIISMLVVGTVAASAAVVTDPELAKVELTKPSGEVVLYDALPSIQDGTFKILESFETTTLWGTGVFGNKTVLDLNGKTLTFKKNNSYAINLRGSSELTIKNGTLVMDTGYANGNGISVKDQTVVNIESTATVIAKGELSVVSLFGGTVNTAGTLSAEDSFCIATNGSNTKACTINVTGGSVTSTGASAIYQPYGTVNISDGTITGKTALYIKAGVTNITGGTFVGTGDSKDYKFNGNGANATGDAVLIDNCGYPQGSPSVTITNGDFSSDNKSAVASYKKADDPAYPTATQPAVENFILGGTFDEEIPDNLTAGGVTLAESAPGEYVATVQNYFSVGNTGYDTFAEAYEAVAEGGTIKLLQDAVLNTAADTTRTHITKNITIDLSGYTLTTAAKKNNDTRYDFMVENGAEVTLQNGKVDSYNGYFGFLVDNGTVTIAKNATYEGFNETTCLFVNPTGTLNVYGTVISHDWYAIGVNGTTSHDYTINIYDGAVVTADGTAECAIYHCNNGTLNISGGTITGPTGVYVKAGTTNITGGTIIANGAKKPFAHDNNGSTDTGDAVVVENCSYPAGSPKITISGGTFTSANGEAVASYAENETYAEVNNFISGGTFSSDVNALAKNGSFFKPNAAGNYTSSASTNPNKLQYKKYNLAGYQNKIVGGSEASTADDGNDINTKGVRIATKFTNNINATEYGYVVAKYEGNKAVDLLDFSNMTTKCLNGEKKIDCTGSVNNIPGFGDGYVTLAVNGMENGDKVVARFYAVINGVTYYSDYISSFGNANSGILVAYNDTVTA